MSFLNVNSGKLQLLGSVGCVNGWNGNFRGNFMLQLKFNDYSGWNLRSGSRI